MTLGAARSCLHVHCNALQRTDWRQAMTTISFTEFRKNASSMMSRVEHGETLLVLRHGQPIAEVSPVRQQEMTTSSWKNPPLRLSIKGKGLAAAIIEERNLETLP